MSTAQDMIGAVERRSKLLESKNMKLKIKILSTMYAQEIVSNQQSVASGSGVLNLDLPVPSTSTTIPMLTSMPGGPQVISTTVGGPKPGLTPFSGPQGGCRVSFGSVFDAHH